MSISYSHDQFGTIQNLQSALIPQTSNWSGTIFCSFLQQIGSNSQLESMKLKKCKIVNGPMYERSAPKQYMCFLKGRSFLYKFYTVTICWPKLCIPSTLNLSTVAHTIYCVCSKILNHGLLFKISLKIQD